MALYQLSYRRLTGSDACAAALRREDTASADERTLYEGIPATTIARALLDCRGVIMDERLIEAAREAARTGLLRHRDAQRVLSDLGATA